MPLSKPAVSGQDLETSVFELFYEFLAGYFDGAAHPVGAEPNVAFPKAVLRFQEVALPQPMTAATGTVGISMVWVMPPKERLIWDKLHSTEVTAFQGAGATVTPGQRQQRALAQCSFLFLIRSVVSGASDNSEKQVQSAGSKLHSVLSNSMATKPLAEKGIHHVRPLAARMGFTGDGAPTADLGFKLRVMTCSAELRWPVLSQA